MNFFDVNFFPSMSNGILFNFNALIELCSLQKLANACSFDS
jgi:hypothetical protein